MRMKQIVLFMLALGAAGSGFANAYCDGYIEGYRAGIEQTTGNSPSETAMNRAHCPLKPAGSNGNTQADYKAGFDKGFKDGARDGSRG